MEDEDWLDKYGLDIDALAWLCGGETASLFTFGNAVDTALARNPNFAFEASHILSIQSGFGPVDDKKMKLLLDKLYAATEATGQFFDTIRISFHCEGNRPSLSLESVQVVANAVTSMFKKIRNVELFLFGEDHDDDDDDDVENDWLLPNFLWDIRHAQNFELSLDDLWNSKVMSIMSIIPVLRRFKTFTIRELFHRPERIDAIFLEDALLHEESSITSVSVAGRSIFECSPCLLKLAKVLDSSYC